MQDSAYRPRPAQLFAVLGCGMIALLSQGLLPLLLGQLNLDHRLPEEAIGLIAGVENLAIALASGLAGIYLPPRHLRLITGVAAVLLVAANLASPIADTQGKLFILRALAGLVEGVLFWIAVSAIARSAVSERDAAKMNFGALLLSFVSATALSQAVLPRLGVTGGFGLMGAVSAIGLLLAILAPNRYPPIARAEGVTGLPPARGLAALAMIVLFNAAGMGFVIYIVPLAARSGLGPDVAGQAIIAMIGAQLTGAGLAALVAGRVNYFRMLVICTVLYAITWPFYALHLSAPAFLALSASLGFITFFAVPFQYPFAVAADPSRRAAVLCGPALMLGATLGPFLASFAVAQRGISGVLELGLGLLFVTILLLLGLHFSPSPHQPTLAN